jgi:hypothetical protein
VQLLGSIVSPFSILKGADKLLSRVAELLQYLCVFFVMLAQLLFVMFS